MQQRDPRKGQAGQGQGKQGQREGQNQPGQNRPGRNPGQQREMEEQSPTEELKCSRCGETFEFQEELDEHEANCGQESV